MHKPSEQSKSMRRVTADAPLGEKLKIQKPDMEQDINVRKGILLWREVFLSDNTLISSVFLLIYLFHIDKITVETLWVR